MNFQNPASLVPLILREALSKPDAMLSRENANITSEDPLPAIVDIGPSGLHLSYRTKFTAVQRETSDDR